MKRKHFLLMFELFILIDQPWKAFNLKNIQTSYTPWPKHSLSFARSIFHISHCRGNFSNRFVCYLAFFCRRRNNCGFFITSDGSHFPNASLKLLKERLFRDHCVKVNVPWKTWKESWNFTRKKNKSSFISMFRLFKKIFHLTFTLVRCLKTVRLNTLSCWWINFNFHFFSFVRSLRVSFWRMMMKKMTVKRIINNFIRFVRKCV